MLDIKIEIKENHSQLATTMSESPIVNFYADQTIFLTGGTGFLGKVLVEKLLRVCQVKILYLLVRPKKGKTTEERFYEYFDFACFNNIKKQNLLAKEKVIFVNGDCEKPNMGLRIEDEEMLIKNTNIVIHAAANVKFDQSLRVAANINVRSTIDILQLAKKMPELKSFLYVSTAFSNCPHTVIEEKCFHPPVTPEELFSILDGIPDDALLNEITPRLLQDWPNAYTFTKSIAEYYLSLEGKGLPIGICRPSIVCVSAHEPMPGWTDNLYGLIGVVLAIGIGVLRSLYIQPDNWAAIVPCDYVCNNILAVIWDTAKEKSNDARFYNINMSEKNSITWRRLFQLGERNGFKFPSNKVLWYPSLQLSPNRTWHKFCSFFQHTVWAYFIDFLLLCFGRKPLAVEKYAKLDKAMDLYAYFKTRQWSIVTHNTEHLWKRLSSTDKRTFNFNMEDLEWSSYSAKLIMGCRVFLLKDPLETIPDSINKMRLLKVAHYTLKALLYFFLYTFVKFVLSFFEFF